MCPKAKKNKNENKTNQLRKYREKRDIGKRDLARLLGVQFASDYYRWESGQRLPSLINALKLSAALQCPVEILFLDHFNQIRHEMHERAGEKLCKDY